MRRDDLIALGEENRLLREEIASLKTKLEEARYEEVVALRRRIHFLEQRLRHEPPRGLLPALLLGAALAVGMTGGLTSLLFRPPSSFASYPAASLPPLPRQAPLIEEPGQLIITGGPVGATIRVDGDIVGATPLFIEVSAGHHRLEVLGPRGEVTDRAELFARPGELTRVTFQSPRLVFPEYEELKHPREKRAVSPIHFVEVGE